VYFSAVDQENLGRREQRRRQRTGRLIFSIMKLASRMTAAWLGGLGFALAAYGVPASPGLTNSEPPFLADLFCRPVVLRLQIEIPRSGIRDLSRHEW